MVHLKELSHLFWPINVVTMSDPCLKCCHSTTQWGTCIWKWALQAVSVGSAHCVLQHFLKCFSSDVSARWPSLYGHASSCTQCFACPLRCSVQTPLHSALCFTDYIVRNLFEMAPIKCSFQVREGQLPLLNFPKKGKHHTKVESIPVSCGFIPCGFIYFLNMSTWAGLTAKLQLKDHCSHVALSCLRMRSARCK